MGVGVQVTSRPLVIVSLPLPVPKLFFAYARDLTALYPFGVGGTGISGLFSGAWAALPTRALRCEPAHDLRPNRLPTVIWRPTVFLALQERPG